MMKRVYLLRGFSSLRMKSELGPLAPGSAPAPRRPPIPAEEGNSCDECTWRRGGGPRPPQHYRYSPVPAAAPRSRTSPSRCCCAAASWAAASLQHKSPNELFPCNILAHMLLRTKRGVRTAALAAWRADAAFYCF